MNALPNVGDSVTFADPLGYSGTGTVEAIQARPHLAVLVKMETVAEGTHRSRIGRSVWMLPVYIEVTG